MAKILAIDVGGTKIAYAVIDENGKFLIEIQRIATPKDIKNLKITFENIIKTFEKEIDAVAFATAGAVNLSNTKVESSTANMPEGYHLIDFSTLTNKPVYVENDANAAAWAEYKVGAAQGENNTITITLGTGVGGGFIVDGKLLRGKSGRGGEVGHIKINSRNRKCTCGRKNCFECYASGTGLKRTAEEIAETNEIFKSGIYKNKNPKDITTYDITEGVKQNDKYSLEVFNIWKQDIITGISGIVNIFDPDSVIISGGMGEYINTEEIQNAVNAQNVVSPVKIKHAKAGNNAGMIGAALLAAEKLLYNKNK